MQERRRTAGLILTERSEVSLLAFNLLPHPPEIPMLVTAQESGLSQHKAEQARAMARGKCRSKLN